MAQRPSNLPNVSKNAVERAREQAKEYESLFAPTTLSLNNGDNIEIPHHPEWGMLDDDRIEAYEELLFEIESYDREPDIFCPEQTLDNGVIVPEETIRGKPLQPFRRTIDGVTELVRPPHRVRIVMAALGDAEYKRLIDGGASAGDVWKIWHRQGLEMGILNSQDSKSSGSNMGVAPVSMRNSK
jgi:hypothetical protein